MNKYSYKVVEKFVSIDGEGIRAGFPVVFIRFAGCNLRCSYCDSMYANEHPEYEVMTIEEILDYVKSTGFHRITLTGGEPLIQPKIGLLIDALIIRGYEVNIETNGSVDIRHVDRRAIITMDYKCPSSGMENKMFIENLLYLSERDVLKFVVGSKEDMEKALQIIKDFEPTCNIYFSPVFGKIEPKEIVKFIIDNKLENCRIQLQLHKIIWEPQMRGV